MARRRMDNATGDSRSRVTNVNAPSGRSTLDISRFLTFRIPVTPIINDDRRTFHPDDPYRAPWASPRYSAHLVVKDVGSRSVKARSGNRSWFEAPPVNVGFRRPDRVAFCVRRKARRQVILALGFGGAGNRKGKRNYSSQFHCK